MSIQIKKSSLDDYINTNNEILVGSIVNNLYASPQQELPVRKGILAATPDGLKISVEDSDGLVWHEVVLAATPGSDNTFTVRFQAQAAFVNDYSMIGADNYYNTVRVDSTCTCYSGTGLFDPVSADSDGFFEITIDKDAYAAVADSEYWVFEWDTGCTGEMAAYYGYIKPQIDITGPTFHPDNSDYNYVVIDNALPVAREFTVGLYDPVDEYDESTSPRILQLQEIFWNPEGEYAMLEPGSHGATATVGETIMWDSGLCPCIEVDLPDSFMSYDSQWIHLKCYIKLPLNDDPSDHYVFSLPLPGLYNDAINVDAAQQYGWIVEYQ